MILFMDEGAHIFMIYIINLTIIFDPENRQLRIKDQHQLATGLSKPATRLLSELVKYAKTELSRDILLKHVWEDYGYAPSNASLSNHISELRKSFELLGEDKEIIATVPKVGFKLEADIYPETRLSGETARLLVDTETQNDAACLTQGDTFDIPVVTESKNRKIMIKIILSLFVLLLVAGMIIINISTDHTTSLIGIDGSCKIYAIDSAKKDVSYYQWAIKNIRRAGINCSREEQNIYYTEAQPFSAVLSTHFIAACPEKYGNENTMCNTYRFSE